MLHQQRLVMEELLAEEDLNDEPWEVFNTPPQMRQHLAPELEEEGLLHSILESPETLSKAWALHAETRERRTSKAKRRSRAVRGVREGEV